MRTRTRAIRVVAAKPDRYQVIILVQRKPRLAEPGIQVWGIWDLNYHLAGCCQSASATPSSASGSHYLADVRLGSPFDMSRYVYGHCTLDCTRFTIIWQAALERAMRKSHHPLDEVAEHVSQVPVNIGGEGRDPKVGIGTLGSMGGQPTAPEVSGRAANPLSQNTPRSFLPVRFRTEMR